MNNKPSRARRMAERLLLPTELVPEVPRTTLHGSSRVCVENHGGIKTYTGQCVEIRTREGLLRIRGDGLQLAAMTAEEIIVDGMVVSVEFC